MVPIPSARPRRSLLLALLLACATEAEPRDRSEDPSDASGVATPAGATAGGQGGAAGAAAGRTGSRADAGAITPATGGGATAGTGGGATAGTGAGGAAGGAGAAGAGSPGQDGAALRDGAPGARDAGVEAGPSQAGMFSCTQFMGPNVTGEWFAAGFEKQVNGDRFQVKAPHRSFVEDWANPNHAVWRETGCDGGFSPCETRSKCAGAAGPDRIVFVTQTGNYLGTPQKAWEASITAAIKTIKAKYPTVTHVELMTFVRGPGNKSCGTETTVAPALDMAHAALAAASGGTITAAPRFEVPRCDYFSGAPHMNAEGNRFVGEMIGKHYAREM